MKPPTSEQAFESAIECALLHGGPDACPHYQAEVREPSAPYALSFAPGGYRRRTSADYDRELCLIPKDVIDFLVASQPKEWRRLRQHRGAGHRDQFLNRLAGELSRRGVVDVPIRTSSLPWAWGRIKSATRRSRPKRWIRWTPVPAMLGLALFLVLAIGGFSPPPASCQDPDDDGPDISECEVDKVTHKDGKLCLHGLKCPDLEAKKLRFDFPG